MKGRGRWFKKSAVLTMGGAVASYLLDPDKGAERRTGVARQIGELRQRVERVKWVQAAKAKHTRAFSPADDRGIANAINQRLSELDVPTPHVMVDVTDGMVVLRGRVKGAADIDLVERAVG